jgi:hypothetical protein
MAEVWRGSSALQGRTVLQAVGNADRNPRSTAKKQLTDSNGLITSWNVDGFGRTTAEIRPDGTRQKRGRHRRLAGDRHPAGDR